MSGRQAKAARRVEGSQPPTKPNEIPIPDEQQLWLNEANSAVQMALAELEQLLALVERKKALLAAASGNANGVLRTTLRSLGLNPDAFEAVWDGDSMTTRIYRKGEAPVPGAATPDGGHA